MALGNLDARRDWGFAGDCVGATYVTMQADTSDDYVIASGESDPLRESCNQALAHVGLDHRDYVKQDAEFLRLVTISETRVDAGRSRTRLGWEPPVAFAELVRMMVDKEVENRTRLIRAVPSGEAAVTLKLRTLSFSRKVAITCCLGENRDVMHHLDKEAALQGQYYEETADSYDDAHVTVRDEHYFALSFMLSVLDDFGVRSILDVGSGTGRAVLHLKQKRPDLHVVGVEPVGRLREVGYYRGLSQTELVPGDVMGLQYPPGAFDLVCSFGVLHHVRQPDVAIAEMLRVAKRAIFISDCNNFGQGSFITRSIKQSLNGLGLWRCAVFLKTRGRGYTMSSGDGLAYSYSVYGNYAQVEKACDRIHVLNTAGDGRNPYRAASHVALLGVKHDGRVKPS